MKNIYLTLIIAIIAGITLTGGDCDDGTGTTGGTTSDPNVLVYNNLVVQELNPNLGSFGGSSPSALNLLLGRVDSSASTNKDVALVDNGSGTNFYWRSGDLSFLDDIAAGMETKFGQLIEWSSITNAEFDTLSKIWKSPLTADTLVPGDFPNTATNQYNPQYFNAPLSGNTVYAFYLKGKKDNGITPNPVYGMIRLDSAWNAGGQFPFRVQVDIKLNIGGFNQFRKEIPAQ